MENQISRRRLLIALGALPLVGACGGSSSDPVVNHYIRAGASGIKDGSSWANAWPTFASVTWTRGDTYYVAGGTYNESVAVSVALSGSNYITIKKANATDNSGDAGWSSAYASTVAIINGKVALDNGYIVFDGVTGSAKSGHGIHINNTNASSDTDQGLVLDTGGHFIISHINIQCAGYNKNTWGYSALRFTNFGTASAGTWIHHCWLHESSTNGIIALGVAGTSFSDYGLLFEDNVISETGGCTDVDKHGQGMHLGLAGEFRFVTIRRNIYSNIIGSAMIALLTNDNNTRHEDIQIYGNIFYQQDPVTFGIISPGAIWQEDGIGFTGVTAKRIAISNNTFYGLNNGTNNNVTGRIAFDLSSVVGEDITLTNNIFEASRFSVANVGLTSQSNNGYFGNVGAAVPSGTTNQVNGSASAFTNAPAGDFSLASGSYAIGAGVGGVDLGATGTVIISSSSKG